MFSSRKKGARSRASSSFRTNVLRGLLVIACVVLLIVGIYYATRLDAFIIQEVHVSGGETISHDLIRSRAEEALAGTYLGLVPKRFAYAYPREAILAQVLDVPRVESVHVEEEKGPALHISVEEYKPAALWCIDTKQESCYFLNRNGFAFAEAPILIGGAFVRHSIEGEESLRRGQILEPQRFQDLVWFGDMLERELNMRAASVYWKENRDVDVAISGGGMVFLASGKDVQRTYENLKTVLNSEEYAHIAPGNFKYVDVRFDKKVFVNEEVASLETATSTEESGEPVSE